MKIEVMESTRGAARRAAGFTLIELLVVFALLAQIHLSAKHDRLSDKCGLATKAGPALAAGLAFARGAGPADIRRIFREFPARLADLTCEGAEPACGRKARRAFRAVAAHVRA